MASSKWMMPMLSPSSSLLDEDHGIMSEAETSSTGLVRRNSRQRSSLPVVRTPSKTLERPLGLVFLQYRNETKRGLLPNEITTLDTVRALFVRSFANQLSMEYLDSHNVRIYIHDPAQDVFYELEDLSDVRDRCILRLHEAGEMKLYDPARQSPPPPLQPQQSPQDRRPFGPEPSTFGSRLVPNYPAQPTSGSWNDLSYFSEPEFDSGYRHQHVHTKPPATTQRPRFTLQRSTTMLEQSTSPPRYDRPSLLLGETSGNYSMDASFERPDEDGVMDGNGGTSFGASSSAPIPMPATLANALPSVAHSAPDQFRQLGAPGSYNLPTPKIYTTPSSPSPYSRSVFDMEFAGPPPVRNNLAHPAMYRNGSLSSSASNATDSASSVDEQTRIRMEQVERQLASLTGLVQTALTTGVPDKSSALSPPPPPPPTSVLPQQANVHRSAEKDATPTAAGCSSGNDKLATETVTHHLTVTDPRSRKTMKEKCVSFEKSVSFCDDPIDLNEGRHTPQPTESKPAKPAIKSSTLPRASSQVTLSRTDSVTATTSTATSSVEMYTQLRLMQKTARELRAEIRQLRRLSIVQSSAVADAVKETIHVVKKTFLNHGDIITASMGGGGGADQSFIESSIRSIRQEEDDYQKDVHALDRDISELETLVENLRSHVINKKMRVSMAEVEKLAVLLSQSSKTIDSLNTRYPPLEESVRSILTYQMERLVEEKRFLTEEPSKMEAMMRRCKKLTSTLVTLRRLASVQEQRKPDVTQEKSMTVPKNFTASVPVPASEPYNPPPASSTGAQREVAGAGRVDRNSPERSQARDRPPAPDATASAAADPSASAPRIGADAAASGQPKERPAPGSPLRIEQQGVDNSIDLLLDELVQINSQIASANQAGHVRSTYLSLVLSDCAVAERRRSSPPPPPARTSSSMNHPGPCNFAKFASEPANVYPAGNEMAYYYHYYNHTNYPAYNCSAAQPTLSSQHSASETAIDRLPECPVHPHRRRARTQENLAESGSRKIALETRHQALLLTRQRLQERYAQVQQWNRTSRSVPMGVSGLRQAAGTRPQSFNAANTTTSDASGESSQSAPVAQSKDSQSKELTETEGVREEQSENEDKSSESSLISHLLSGSAMETDIM